MLNPSSVAPTLKVAIYRTSSLGDTVLATACLDLLSRLPMPVETVWIGRGPALELIKASWPEVRAVEVRRSDTMKDLQRAAEQVGSPHVIVDLQRNLRSKWLTRILEKTCGAPVFTAEKAQLARSRLIVEARLRGRRKPLPQAALDVPKYQFQMMCDALRDALRFHLPAELQDGLDAPDIRPRLPIPDLDDRPWRKELRFGAWLAVAPGAAHPTKEAPHEVVVSILRAVRERAERLNGQGPRPLGLVFLGDESERAVARRILDELHWPDPVLNLAGKLSLWESALALSEVSALLSNDSSLAHIAEAVDTPVGVLFGPTIESFGFAPRMRRSRAFSAPIGCRPCSKHGKIDCRYGDKLCFHAIAIDDVADHLMTLLTAPEARHLRRQVPQESNVRPDVSP